MKNNKLLIGVLVVLVVIWGLSQMIGGEKKRTFREKLVEIDTSAVTLIQIIVPQEEKLDLSKDSEGWKVDINGEKVPAIKGKVDNLLALLTNLKKPKRVAATSADKWQEFQVDKEKGIQVITKEGNTTTLDMTVGKFAVAQNPQQPPQQMMQGRQQPQITSFLRIEGDEATYAIDGMLKLNLKQKPNELVDSVAMFGNPVDTISTTK